MQEFEMELENDNELMCFHIIISALNFQFTTFLTFLIFATLRSQALRFCMLRKTDHKHRTFARCTFRLDFTTMKFNNFFAYRQADAGSFNLMVAVQSFKYDKNIFGKFLIKADTIVTDHDFIHSRYARR